MKRIALLMIPLLLCFAAGAVAENIQPASNEMYECGDYIYILMEDGTAAIINYIGAASELEVPGEIEGHRWPTSPTALSISAIADPASPFPTA